MSAGFGSAPPKRPPSVKRSSRKALLIALGILAALLVAASAFASLYVDAVWFGSVGYGQVFWKEAGVKAAMFFPLAAVFAVVLYIFFRLLDRRARALAGSKVLSGPSSGRGRILACCAGLACVLAAVFTGMLWEPWLEKAASSPVNLTDPLFGLDVSFFMFDLPFWSALTAAAATSVLILAAASAIYTGAVVVFTRAGGAKAPALNAKTVLTEFRRQLCAFTGVLLLLAGVGSRLARYEVVFSDTGSLRGAFYTDAKVSGVFSAAGVAACVALSAAVFILGNRGKIKPLLICAGAFAAVQLLGLIGPALYESYVVSPNQLSMEAPYIAQNIRYTRLAYGLDSVRTVPFDVSGQISPEQISQSSTTVSNIPVNDWSPTLSVYNSLQGIRPYYRFTDIDVDRYEIAGASTQVFIAAREMDASRLNSAAQNWINLHLKYTHGFGVAVSPVNAITPSGQPVLSVRDLPPESSDPALAITQPRIYFGELTGEYAVLRTDEGEFDYPMGEENAEYFYEADCGIPLTFLNRVAFALHYGEAKFLLSGDLNRDSVILINRNIMSRVEKIAPFLKFGDDPYIVISEGRLMWIIDGITVTDRFPFSQPFEEGYNYARNSVKITVDAYTGETIFYVCDETDALASLYSRIYPGMLRPVSEMPEDLRSHLRYSETFFDIQSRMYASYHVENVNVFYNREDLWQSATQLYNTRQEPSQVNPAYVVMRLPGRDSEEFMLMAPFTPAGKDNMVAWLAGLCDGEDYGSVIAYQFPKQELVYGPMQIEKRIDQDAVIAPQLNLLSQQGSRLLRGNMMTIPIGNSILYVKAIYVQASGAGDSLPEVKKIIVCSGERIVMADTLGQALDSIFGQTVTIPGQTGDDLTLSQLIARASELYRASQEAMRAGDWAAYGEHISKLGEVLEQIQKLAPEAP